MDPKNKTKLRCPYCDIISPRGFRIRRCALNASGSGSQHGEAVPQRAGIRVDVLAWSAGVGSWKTRLVPMRSIPMAMLRDRSTTTAGSASGPIAPSASRCSPYLPQRYESSSTSTSIPHRPRHRFGEWSAQPRPCSATGNTLNACRRRETTRGTNTRVRFGPRIFVSLCELEG